MLTEIKLDSRRVQQPEVWSLDTQSETCSFRNLIHFSLHHFPYIACYAFLYLKKPNKTFDPNVQCLHRIAASRCYKKYLLYITKCCMVWCMWVLVSFGTPRCLRDGLAAVPVAVGSGTGMCGLCRLWGHGGCAGTKPGTSSAVLRWNPNAILWLVTLAGVWGRLCSTGLCTINRNEFSDLEGGLISLAIFLILMFCHLGLFL